MGALRIPLSSRRWFALREDVPVEVGHHSDVSGKARKVSFKEDDRADLDAGLDEDPVDAGVGPLWE